MIHGALKRCMAQLVAQVAIGPGTQEDVNALYVSPHARDVERGVRVVVHFVQLAASVYELLHDPVVASVASLVERIIFVDHSAVGTGSVPQEESAELWAVVADGPVERGDRESLPVLEEVADALVHVEEPPLEERDGVVLVAALDGSQELVVFEVVGHRVDLRRLLTPASLEKAGERDKLCQLSQPS